MCAIKCVVIAIPSPSVLSPILMDLKTTSLRITSKCAPPGVADYKPCSSSSQKQSPQPASPRSLLPLPITVPTAAAGEKSDDITSPVTIPYCLSISLLIISKRLTFIYEAWSDLAARCIHLSKFISDSPLLQLGSVPGPYQFFLAPGTLHILL